MACNTVTTGQGFLVETLSHLDCQAQAIGSYGFQSLAAPGSPATMVVTALLTLFIAIFGIRLLFGGDVRAQDAFGAVLRIGIVLTLATSWPAYRTLAYDTVLHGPAEVAAFLGGSSLPDMGGGLAQRLQELDDGVASLTTQGTGRQTGSLIVPGEDPQSFTRIALQDESGFGWGRTIFLASTIGPLAALRLAAGLLLAIAPLVAGLLLFDFMRGLFAGWLRGLVLTAIGSLGITLLLSVQVAVMTPWVSSAFNRRDLGYATPAAPTELLALSLGFAIAAFGLLAILARVAFHSNPALLPWSKSEQAQGERRTAPERMASSHGEREIIHSRAMAVGDGVRSTMRYQSSWHERQEVHRLGAAPSGTVIASAGQPAGPGASRERLGSSYRRNSRRTTASHRQRDRG